MNKIASHHKVKHKMIEYTGTCTHAHLIVHEVEWLLGHFGVGGGVLLTSTMAFVKGQFLPC